MRFATAASTYLQAALRQSHQYTCVLQHCDKLNGAMTVLRVCAVHVTKDGLRVDILSVLFLRLGLVLRQCAFASIAQGNSFSALNAQAILDSRHVLESIITSG
jgi:hypothetical protein